MVLLGSQNVRHIGSYPLKRSSLGVKRKAVNCNDEIPFQLDQQRGTDSRFLLCSAFQNHGTSNVFISSEVPSFTWNSIPSFSHKTSFSDIVDGAIFDSWSLLFRPGSLKPFHRSVIINFFPMSIQENVNYCLVNLHELVMGTELVTTCTKAFANV